MSETYTPDNLIAGDFPLVSDEVTVISGQNVARGCVLGKITASGKYTACDQLASDGSQTPEAVLAQATDASGGDVTKAPVYLTGEFNSSLLTFGATTTAADLKAAMRTKSLFQKAPVTD